MTHGVTYVSTLSDDLRTLSYEAALYFYPLILGGLGGPHPA